MVLVLAALLVLSLAMPLTAFGQSLASRLPALPVDVGVPMDVEKATAPDAEIEDPLEKLSRTVSLHVEGVSIKQALQRLAAMGDLQLAVDDDLLPDRRVTVDLENASLLAALYTVIEGTGLRFKVSPSGYLVVVPGPKPQPAASAEERALFEVAGTVTDAETGNSLPGVNVVVKGTTIGTATDVSGNYSLNAPSPQDTLVFSFVGYEPQEVAINGRSTIDVALASDIEALEEVVVVGYGTQEREDLTGAVASVTAEELDNAVSASFDEALQGRVAGVMVMSNSGRPGGGVTVRIRGVNTLGGNTAPLYVIDGVPIDGDSEAITNPLALVNPANIQSIDVLKGASAAAIYGSRASNGVVIVTTKRGRAGELRVDYDAYVGAQTLPGRIEVMNLRQFARFSNHRAEIIGYGTEPGFANPSLLGEGTNWQDALYRTAPMTKHNLSVSGGNAQTQYLLSAGYFYQQGLAISSDFRRYNVRLNLDNQPTEWMQIGTSLALSRVKENVSVSSNDLINTAIRQRPDIPVRYPDGSWGGPDESQFALGNPVALAMLNTDYSRRSQVLGNLYASINLLEGLTLRNELNGTFSFGKEKAFTPTYSFNANVNSTSSLNWSTSAGRYWQIKNYLNYNDAFGALDLDAVAGHEVQASSWEGLSASRSRFVSNSLQQLPAGDADTAQNTSYGGSNSLQSFFSRVNLSYDDRYLLTASIRADASSNFSANYRWGVFPAVAGAWRLGNEAFMQGVDFIDQLKLRAAYGYVGNQDIGGNLFVDSYSVVTTEWGTGVRPNQLGNPDVHWESTESMNLGMDLSVLNRRVNLTVDAYIKRTHGLLLELPLPSYVGTSGVQALGAPVVNLGSLENRGLEFALNTVNLQGEFQWESGLVLTMNRNEVTELNSPGASLDGQIRFTGNLTVVTRTTVGQPVGQFYGYVVEGIFTNEEQIRNHAHPDNVTNADGTPDIDRNNGVWVGDLMFKDLNGDGLITAADRTFIGNPNPDFTYGINNRFSYGNFDLSVFINGTYGNEIYNRVRRRNENPSGNYGLLESVSNYARIVLKNPDDPSASLDDISDVTLANPETRVPRISGSNVYGNNRVSTRYIEDGSYLRIQNVTLGYTLPPDLIEAFSLRELRVYATVENLYTLTGYSGYDPEIGQAEGRPFLLGVDWGRYPTPRVFTIGVNIGL